MANFNDKQIAEILADKAKYSVKEFDNKNVKFTTLTNVLFDIPFFGNPSKMEVAENHEPEFGC